MAGISLRGITKIYPGDVKAVDDFDLEISPREFIVFVGPSGCGKSTTLRMIAGLEEITQGELYIGDKLVNDVAPKNRDIAMVFQNYALYPHMTVYMNMGFGLKLRKVPKAEIDKKVQAAADSLGIGHLLHRKPRALSGGERQRVALGRAIVRNPAAFLLDEPLSNLDAKLRSSMRAELTKLHKKLGVIFVYVTHDQTEAMTMGDRIVVMHQGKIKQADTPANLYDHPQNLFVAGFIGTPPMNFLDGVIAQNAGGLHVKIGDMAFPIDTRRFSTARPGQSVVVGIRPEDMQLLSAQAEAPAVGVLDAVVERTEMMGAEVFVYTSWNGQSLTVRAPAKTRAGDGQRVKVAVDCEKIHLFDKENEEAIS